MSYDDDRDDAYEAPTRYLRRARRRARHAALRNQGPPAGEVAALRAAFEAKLAALQALEDLRPEWVADECARIERCLHLPSHEPTVRKAFVGSLSCGAHMLRVVRLAGPLNRVVSGKEIDAWDELALEEAKSTEVDGATEAIEFHAEVVVALESGEIDGHNAVVETVRTEFASAAPSHAHLLDAVPDDYLLEVVWAWASTRGLAKRQRRGSNAGDNKYEAVAGFLTKHLRVTKVSPRTIEEDDRERRTGKRRHTRNGRKRQKGRQRTE